MARTSIKGVAKQAQRDDTRLRQSLVATPKKTKDGTPSLTSPTLDSFVNFAQKMGVGADNPLSTATYGFNPISRNRTLLEWMHRGSWLAGLSVDVVADDMTRAGIEYVTELDPEVSERLDRSITTLKVWHAINETIKWGRLYGGCIGVVLIEGQDMRTPLRVDTVGPGQFKGIAVLDRWMIEPMLDDLVTEFGPNMGLPKYYRVGPAAPVLRGAGIHHSRVAFRHVGVDLPYQQRMVENLWGISVLERLHDRMVGFDSASTGAAQLVYKAYLRTFKVDGLRDIVSAGGAPLAGLTAYVDNVRRFQSIEGMSLIDKEDEFEAQTTSALSGMADVLIHLGQQLSGALQIPLVRLFGQSPAGLNSTGESDLRMYYDNINQRQKQDIYDGTTLVYKLAARSEGVALPPTFAIAFKSLWQLKDDEKQNIAKTNSEIVSSVLEAGIISPQTALKELRQASRITGVFTNITRKMIDEADDQIPPPPSAEGAMPGMPPIPGQDEGSAPPAQGEMNGQAGPQGQAPQVDQGTQRRARIQLTPPGGGQAGGAGGQGTGTQRPGQGASSPRQGAA